MSITYNNVLFHMLIIMFLIGTLTVTIDFPNQTIVIWYHLVEMGSSHHDFDFFLCTCRTMYHIRQDIGVERNCPIIRLDSGSIAKNSTSKAKDSNWLYLPIDQIKRINNLPSNFTRVALYIKIFGYCGKINILSNVESGSIMTE